MFQVLQDDKPADSSGYPDIKFWSPKLNNHNTFEDAVKYAHLWCFPITDKDYNSECSIKMELNVPVNMSMSEFPVMMKIVVAEQ